LDRIRRLFLGVEKGVKFNHYQLGGYLQDEVADIVSSYARYNVRYPLGATINKKTGEIIPETMGKIIDIKETVDKIFSADQGEKVTAVNYKITPYLTEKDLLALTEEMSAYQTIITGGFNRRANIKLAVELINNTVVESGGVFSFNQQVGPRNKKRGFKESPEIIEGELSLGVGGGICQVSSTLYNAVNLKGIEIIELHHHSQNVSYVPQGKDATVAWRYLDFKFKNKFPTPIIIKAQIKGSKLQISLIGAKN
ncbi:MAG: VanW family protein, partial [Bacillota bacterium]